MYLPPCRECESRGLGALPTLLTRATAQPPHRDWRDVLSDAILLATFVGMVYNWTRKK